MRCTNTGHQIELFRRQMPCRSNAGGAEIQRLGPRLGGGDDIGHAAKGPIHRHGEHIRHLANQGNRRQILQGIEGKIAVKRRVDRERPNSPQQQCIAIRRAACGCFGGDIAARTRAVFNHDRLAKQGLQTRRNGARKNIRGTARGKAHQ